MLAMTEVESGFAALARGGFPLRFPGAPEVLADRGAGEMGVDRFVPLALQLRHDVGKIVAVARIGEFEGAFDGRSAGG